MTLAERIQAVVTYYKSIQRPDGKPYHPRMIVTKEDRRRIELVLTDKHDPATVDDCCLAILGCHVNPWNLGENPSGKRYLSISIIFRGDNFGRFIEEGEQHNDEKAAAESLALADAEAKRAKAADEAAARQEPRESLVKAFRQNQQN